MLADNIGNPWMHVGQQLRDRQPQLLKDEFGLLVEGAGAGRLDLVPALALALGLSLAGPRGRPAT